MGVAYMGEIAHVESLENFAAAGLARIAGRSLLLELEPVVQSGPVEWARNNAVPIDRLVGENGALLIRGLGIADSDTLGGIFSMLFKDEQLDYIYRSTPRTKLQNKVYTASEYHPGETILLHNENSYTNRWPLRIAFCCIKPPAQGGQTPIADSRDVFRSMPADIVETFDHKGLMYVRNYGSIDLPWSEVFQTTDRKAAESYCADNDIEVEWLPNNGLRTRQFTPGVQKHPVTSEPVWFNSAHMFHVSSLRQDVHKAMVSLVGEENLPRNVYYGDGSRIPNEVFDRIRAAYLKNKILFDWQAGDLLILDNMLFAHGREPFAGDRRVLVAMARGMSARRQAGGRSKR
jgi:hypothetical protein